MTTKAVLAGNALFPTSVPGAKRVWWPSD